jgi:hypothetical protein
MRLEKIVDGVARFYDSFQLSPERAELIRAGVLDELAADRQQAAGATARAKLRISRLHDERQKLLAAHYDDVVPLDMLKTEMHRLTQELVDAEEAVTAAARTVADLEGTLRAALAVAANCARAYLALQ